jgi:hypothetical protein
MLQSANDRFFSCCFMALFCQSMLVAVFHDQLRLKSMPLLMSLGCCQISMDSFTSQSILPFVLVRTLCLSIYLFTSRRGHLITIPQLCWWRENQMEFVEYGLKKTNACMSIYACWLPLWCITKMCCSFHICLTNQGHLWYWKPQWWNQNLRKA